MNKFIQEGRAKYINAETILLYFYIVIVLQIGDYALGGRLINRTPCSQSTLNYTKDNEPFENNIFYAHMNNNFKSSCYKLRNWKLNL